MDTTTIYFEIFTGETNSGWEELGFEVEVYIGYDKPDRSVGYYGGHYVTFDPRPVFKLEGTDRTFTKDELRVLLALGGDDLDKALKNHEDQAIDDYKNQNEPDFDEPDPYDYHYDR